ncbi:hypothetical protein Sango_1251400 [Sesamum angolense]|uniref:Uncharacterized protein n=1 Tax=Sesamum angolense TaxID=2727404 RepID=A0AAE2BU00_9LAMI|nr:hypothetical protein Sango_1251400 [Sesamum angolense]
MYEFSRVFYLILLPDANQNNPEFANYFNSNGPCKVEGSKGCMFIQECTSCHPICALFGTMLRCTILLLHCDFIQPRPACDNNEAAERLHTKDCNPDHNRKEIHFPFYKMTTLTSFKSIIYCTEDNFFGPVSANFIRPGRLSDSAASDDNHDVTMDSTAFSMHYRSLALSESGVDLKTPTAGQLFFEEKTPTNANIGSSMVFTLGKKPIPKSSMPVTEVNDSHNSNDMSLVGENPNKYNYDKLSPGLDALLAESSKNLLSVSVSDDVTTSASPKRKESEVLPSVDHEVDLVNPSDCIRKEIGGINSRNVLNGVESTPRREFGEANGPHRTFQRGLSPKTFSSSTLGAAASNIDNYKPNTSPDQLSNDESETALVPSTSSRVKQRQLLRTTVSPSRLLGAVSPLLAKLFPCSEMTV